MLEEHVILPFIILVIGLVSIFVDSKGGKNKRLIVVLICALLVSCTLEIYFKIKDHIKDKENSDTIKQLRTTIDAFWAESSGDHAELRKILSDWGYLNHKLQDLRLVEIEQSFEADKERTLSVSQQSGHRTESITVEYFPKDVDREKVVAALKELGFKLVFGKTKLADFPTNIIWFGRAVSIEDVKLVAYTLIRAGVQIKAIRPFRDPNNEKTTLIAIGALASVADSLPLTVEEIRVTSSFTLD